MKNRITLWILFVVLLPGLLQAQIEPVFKTRPAHEFRMLIVPFDTRIYLNDATPEMATRYNMTHDELMMFFRMEWNRHLHMAFLDSCYTVDLLTDNTREARDDLDGLYTIIRYEMKTKMQNKPEQPEEQSWFRKMFPKKKKQVSDDIYVGGERSDGEIISRRQTHENRYFHIAFTDTTFLQQLAQRRNIDFFLFINQFEIKGNYSDPYASGRSDFSRSFKVHFSIYDNLGELVHGSYAEVDVPFHLYDKDVLVGEYFPPAIRQIIYNFHFSY